MNLTSTLVGLSIMGASAPVMMKMSIAPFEASLRAENLGVAETAAVVYAASHEGTLKVPANTDTCTVEAREGTENAYSVTCTHGNGRYVQSVTRAFRLAVPEQAVDDVDRPDDRQFQFETPTRFSGHQCPIHDQWGVYGHNDQYYEALGGACIPRAVWNEPKYQFSNPDAWLYDVNNFNGWGNHPDY